MQRSDFVKGIKKVWEIADQLKIAEVFSNGSTLPVDVDFRDIALSVDATYPKVYLMAMNKAHYNILLSDYSFFQFSLQGEQDLRYAFYPNPFASGTEEGLAYFQECVSEVEEGVLSHEDFLSLVSGESRGSGVPMFRYENAPGQRKKFRHPCSHMHIGFHSENRWPVRRVLTPAAFALMVFKAYYDSSWYLSGDDDACEFENSFERQLVSEKADSRLVSVDYFEPVEERTFFIA